MKASVDEAPEGQPLIEAKKMLNLARNWLPHDASVLRGLAKISSELGQAREYLEEAVQLNPQNPFLHVELGDLYYSSQKYELALEQYRAAGYSSEQSAVRALVSYIELAKISLVDGQVFRASTLLQEALKIDPENLAVQYWLWVAEGGESNASVSNAPSFAGFSLNGWQRWDDHMWRLAAEALLGLATSNAWDQQTKRVALHMLAWKTPKQVEVWLADHLGHRLAPFVKTILEERAKLDYDQTILSDQRACLEALERIGAACGKAGEACSVGPNMLINPVSDSILREPIPSPWFWTQGADGIRWRRGVFVGGVDLGVQAPRGYAFRIDGLWVEEEPGNLNPARAGVAHPAIRARAGEWYVLTFWLRTPADEELAGSPVLYVGHKLDTPFHLFAHLPQTQGRWLQAVVVAPVDPSVEEDISIVLQNWGVGTVWYASASLCQFRPPTGGYRIEPQLWFEQTNR